MILYEEPLKMELLGRNIYINGNPRPFSTRKLSDMKDVLMSFPKNEFDPALYFMYRDIMKRDDIRYDITVIPPRIIGKEYVKTYGHYHTKSKSGKEYPELYQILSGGAIFIMQKRNNNESVEVIIVQAEKGDVILMLPDYGHISINPLEEVLVMGNLVYDGFKSQYGEYKKNNGAAYYYTNERMLVQNQNYVIKNMKKMKPSETLYKYGIVVSDLLKEFKEKPERFSFLKNPSF